MAKLTFTLLGTGSSGGVPRIGNDWGSCDPENSKNRRRRCALLIEQTIDTDHKTTVLIDAGADLREQMLSADVKELDAVCLTHSHADHIFGLDDLRQMAISLGRSIDVFMDQQTSEIVNRAFGYCFHQAEGSSYPSFCTEQRLEHATPVTVKGAGGDIELLPFAVEHGDIQSLGFRINDLVYLPDIKRVHLNESKQALREVDTLILDALRRKPHPTHLNLDEALEFSKAYGPTRTILTNMHADMDYETLIRSLPSDFKPGYDGMKITLSRDRLS